MLKVGKFGSDVTATEALLDDVRPKKFVKPSVIVYDALVRFCARMVMGLATWYAELKVLR